MTWILGTIGKDCIVLAADGKATGVQGEVKALDYRKIYSMGRVLVTFSAQNAYPDELLNFAGNAQAILPQPLPFNVKDYAEGISSLAKVAFQERKELELGMLVAGYDRDKDGRKTTPRIYGLQTKKDYLAEDLKGSKGIIQLGIVRDLPPIKSNSLDYLSAFMPEVIKNCDDPSVGGSVTVSVITPNREYEFIEHP